MSLSFNILETNHVIKNLTDKTFTLEVLIDKPKLKYISMSL